MKRVVKAWMYETRGGSFWVGLDHRMIFKTPPLGRATRVAITYDDGRKRRARTHTPNRPTS